MIDFVSNSETLSQKYFLTIVVVTFERVELLKGMLRTLKQALDTVSNLPVQVRVGINGLDAITEELLTETKLSQIFPNLEVVQIKQRLTPAEARNVICFENTSEWTLFLDDDVEIPVEFFKNFLKLSELKPDVSVWGGPNITPKNSSLHERKIGWLLQNYFVVGPVANRYKMTTFKSYLSEEFFLSLCNLFVKTDIFRKVLFNSSLKTAEENELIYRVLQEEKTLMSSPLLYVWHYRRKTFNQFLKQIKNYGFGRGQLLYSYKLKNKIFLLIGGFAAFALVAAFPIQILQIITIWIAAIFLNYLMSFKEKSLSFMLLPFGVWTHYAVGIVSGYLYSHRQAKQTYLYSRT